MPNILFLFEVFFLTMALSLDTFISGIAYGSNRIKVPFYSYLIINAICSLILGISIFFGDFLSSYISSKITLIICVTILITLGIIKIFDSYIKNVILKYNGIDKNIRIKILDVKMTLNLYAAPEEADLDKSKVLSIYEALLVAFSLSLDSITIGIGAGITNITPTYGISITIFSFIIGMILLFIGIKLGNTISRKLKMNISWIGGILLIIIAIIKLF